MEARKRVKTKDTGTNGSQTMAIVDDHNVFKSAKDLEGLLEGIPINIIFCDNDLVVQYANKKSVETLSGLQQFLPIPADQMIGETIDVFHKNPSFQRGILSDSRNLPLESNIALGPETLSLKVEAVFGENKSQLGYLLTWDVVTEKLNGEAELARIQSMLEYAPLNIMCADLDGIIQYLNPKSTETLKSIEDVLPVPVDKIANNSYDVFHKLPSHQRKMLADESNLPHKAIIQVGPHFLDLFVSPMKDSEGIYIGPMVTWDVVTEKLKGERELARIQSMMENAPINIMCADLEGVIQYLNPKSMETLKSIQDVLPVPVDKITGGSYDVFHKLPAHQRKMLATESNLPHKAIIQVGPHMLDLFVSPMRDQSGTYIGPMVTWDVVTEKLKGEAELARIQSMVENAPINIMCADKDGIVQYMNPKSIETLRSIQDVLPVPVDKIVGGSYDIFHKAPAHQRKILASDANLPHKAVIQIGPHSLELHVSAMRDADDDYIGPMVTWEVVTQRLELIEALETTSGQLGTSAEELSATATAMAKNAGETSTQSIAASTASDEVSKGVQAVATNTEEMASSIREIAKASSDASDISKNAMEQAKETNETISLLGEASREIGNVIKVISSIAQQTNLLALNATIEAARAGDAGKGFAVVANEVKELAKQTAQATDDITNKINNIQSSSDSAVTAIAGISKVIEEVNNIAMSIAASVEEQSATTNEVSRVIQESNRGVEGISETVKTVAEAAKESSVGAEQTLEAAKGLSKLAESLSELVEKVKS